MQHIHFALSLMVQPLSVMTNTWRKVQKSSAHPTFIPSHTRGEHKTVHTMAGCLLFYCAKQLPMPLSTGNSRQSMEKARTWPGFLMNFCTLLCVLREFWLPCSAGCSSWQGFQPVAFPVLALHWFLKDHYVSVTPPSMSKTGFQSGSWGELLNV